MAKIGLQSCLNYIYEHYKKDTAKMLVISGTVGWGLSSLGQVIAIGFNPKIDRKEKGFLVPQAVLDMAVNIGAFFLITQTSKKMISKLISSGKIAPQKVRQFLNENKEYKDKVGKLSLNLDDVLEKEKDFPKETYLAYKNYASTMGTIGASILATNIVTPILRNSGASEVQKKYIERRPQVSGNMKI